MFYVCKYFTVIQHLRKFTRKEFKMASSCIKGFLPATLITDDIPMLVLKCNCMVRYAIKQYYECIPLKTLHIGPCSASLSLVKMPNLSCLLKF